MKNNQYLLIGLLLLVFTGTGCKKDLDIINPNDPTPASAATETGIISLAQGGVYVNGFRNLKYSDGVFGLFWSGAMGFHELMGDVIGAEAANAFLNQIGCPDRVVLDNGTAIVNPNAPNTAKAFLRQVNQNTNQGQNFLYYEWSYMYNMISACNSVLETLDKVSFTGSAAAKKATIQAWCYFWKGFAYSHIGSIYYAGLINNTSFATSGNYVSKEAILTEANSQLDKAATALGAAGAGAGDYTAIMEGLIPSFNKVGNGKVMTTAMWLKLINTLKARNILVNTPASAMTAAQWTSILTLTNSGVGATDYVFTGRSNTTGDFLAPTSGTVAVRIQSTNAGGGGYKLSERWVQEFTAGDRRFTQNVKQTTAWIGNTDRGNVFNTRFTLYNNGNGVSGTKVFASNTPGAVEITLAGSYEENELMKAEAKINSGDINGGLANIDNVRTYQGAGLAALAGSGLTLVQAKEALRKERRIALAFLGLSFYDYRRYGYLDNPRTGCSVINSAGAISTNATITYGFLDYWDVPDNELAYNPAASGSAPVKNPK
jgi:starch-binding outer membrane protein, SusD/RagB family